MMSPLAMNGNHKGKPMTEGRIVIIPFLHGKLDADGSLIEPDIDGILEKWLQRRGRDARQ